ncbi:TRAP-like protein, partial [Fragilariopsis cylindrus CCMP1102]
KYAITGKESQIVTIQLESNEVCQGEPGSMMYLSSGVAMHASCGSDCFGRCCGGESCCVVNFTNNGGNDNDGTNTARYAALVPNEPLAKVIPVDMSSKEVNGILIVQPGAYMASFGDVRIGYSCDCNIIRCCCGGMGLVRQKIEGTGTAFLGATGTIVQKVLDENEIMLMDTNCILAYADTCTFDLKRAGGLVGMIGGGEGIFNSSLKGPGLVIVQSMNMKVMLECLAAEKMYRR